MSNQERPRRGTRRAESKEATRARVLDAAEALFNERGWEPTTLREVARSAGVSTGAIFGNFSDKTDLFRAVMERDLTRLMERMNACAEREKLVDKALLEVFMCGYRHYDGKLPVLRALQHMMWAQEGAPVREVLARLPLRALFLGRLRIAVVWKELADQRLEARSHMLLDSYMANFAQALYGGWDLAMLRKRSQAQIEIILAGAQAR